MRSSIVRKSAVLLAGLVLVALAPGGVSSAQGPPLPNPVLVFLGQEPFETNGKQFMRYNYEVMNRDAYPNTLFAASPELPPCGSNTKSARTWVDLYDQAGKRLNGFCAIGTNGGLSRLWFALDSDVIPPSWIYVELNDRKTGTKYKSNLAETTY